MKLVLKEELPLLILKVELPVHLEGSLLSRKLFVKSVLNEPHPFIECSLIMANDRMLESFSTEAVPSVPSLHSFNLYLVSGEVWTRLCFDVLTRHYLKENFNILRFFDLYYWRRWSFQNRDLLSYLDLTALTTINIFHDILHRAFNFVILMSLALLGSGRNPSSWSLCERLSK